MKQLQTPAVLDRIVDRVVRYNPKAKRKRCQHVWEGPSAIADPRILFFACTKCGELREQNAKARHKS